ncbi:Hypothetical predicted protein [Mytilus galloprovincialis]|uniref:Mab-21-like HhH/H2TH-like domain-containing protein n=1 Tax=Mytilus galloprovincialis TaxID=29158 RepID=A0A8B6CIM1_MYTGA|nr:Hypothetical predicted protein [Mytilus galloprovincialis]
MSKSDRIKSLEFYAYLCQKVGSEEIVKSRRLLYTIGDIAMDNNYPRISSGSKGEGLNFKGSDTDVMFIEPDFRVYESMSDVTDRWGVSLLMDTDETPPCFTYLNILPKYGVPFLFTEQLRGQKNGKMLLSSELFKIHRLRHLVLTKPMLNNIHGPCISDDLEQNDIAYCIKCEKWISQAQPWISRPRTEWPPPDLISQIISLGVLFVPIGCKGSVNENFEWRISFSVAEKMLIFSFCHTQLLCYALLKILLREVIEKFPGLKGLLCSYFLKTLMFWISEELDPSVWRPDNIIPCFIACLQKLLYCVEYSTLLHYFIPNNNLFYSRFDISDKRKLVGLLQNVYQKGIHCFSSSETLHDYPMSSCNMRRQLSLKTILAQETIHLFSFGRAKGNIYRLMNNLMHHSKSCTSRSIFNLFFADAHHFVPELPNMHCRPTNKQKYFKYKHYLSQLLIGVNSDAISGWLLLATFFYSHKHYTEALIITDHVFSKYTDKTFPVPVETSCNIVVFHELHDNVMELMKHEKTITIVKNLTNLDINLDSKSLAVLPELQQDAQDPFMVYNCKPMAHFIRFLSYYYRGNVDAYENAFMRLLREYIDNMNNKQTGSERMGKMFQLFYTMYFLGISAQMIGESELAKEIFRSIAICDVYNYTSAASRLSKLI